MHNKRIRILLLTILAPWIMLLPTAAESPTPRTAPIIVGLTKHPFDMDLTRAIAREMGLNVWFKVFPANLSVQALKDGEVDVLAHAAYTESRAKMFDFSPSYSTMHLTLFGRKDSPPMRSMANWYTKDVMVWKGHSISAIAVEEGWKSIMFVDSYEEMLRLLDSGKHDYAALNARTAVNNMVSLGLNNITATSPEPIVLKYCFAVKKGNRRMLDPFIKGLGILHKTGEYERIRIKWFADDLMIQGIQWKQVVRYGGMTAALFLVVLSTIFLWTWMLKKQVVQRTAELSLEIEERQRVEDELRRNQEKMVQAEKLAAIGTLVSGVAHEINNPNGLILMNVTMLKEMHKDFSRIIDKHYESVGDFEVGDWRYSKVRENLENVLTETVEASKRIARTIEDLKNFSRRDDPALNEDVNLNAVAMSAIRLVDNIIRKSTDSFNARYAEYLPKIRGNSQRIEQVVVNLLMNASQALPDKGKGIELTTRYDADNRTVVLEVKDEGVGIDQEQLRYVTDPFYTTKREQGGTGLGLSVSSTIIKEHGGLLAFSSRKGKGTTVTVSFPIA
jgi:polar amino acid transport system substrate-binding protein